MSMKSITKALKEMSDSTSLSDRLGNVGVMAGEIMAALEAGAQAMGYEDLQDFVESKEMDFSPYFEEEVSQIGEMMQASLARGRI